MVILSLDIFKYGVGFNVLLLGHNVVCSNLLNHCTLKWGERAYLY